MLWLTVNGNRYDFHGLKRLAEKFIKDELLLPLASGTLPDLVPGGDFACLEPLVLKRGDPSLEPAERKWLEDLDRVYKELRAFDRRRHEALGPGDRREAAALWGVKLAAFSEPLLDGSRISFRKFYDRQFWSPFEKDADGNLVPPQTDAAPDKEPGETLILVIDDDRDAVFLFRLLLGKKGYRTAAGFNGEEAVSLAGRLKPDLILLNLMMPGKDGYTACRELRSNPETSDIKIILFSANPRIGELADEAGADAFFVSPTDPQKLAGLVENTLNRR